MFLVQSIASGTGQNILSILLRHPLWKLGSLLLSFSVILQHLASYNRTGRTQLLYSLILVFLLMLVDFQMIFSLVKAPLAFPNLALMPSSAPPSFVTMLPRYVNKFVFIKLLTSSCILAGCFVFIDITSVFFTLIFRPILLAFDCNFDALLFIWVSRCDNNARSSGYLIFITSVNSATKIVQFRPYNPLS